jgi:hypothetical protein
LNRLDEFAVSGIDDDAVLLAVADVHVAVIGIDGDPMDHTEVSLPGVVAKPFLDEFAVLIEVPDTRQFTPW